LSAPADYAEEAADLLPRIVPEPGRGVTLLELGCGGGNLASHLKAHARLTLTDVASGMLAMSRRLNPECEHHLGDMRTLRLGRRFDVVLIHDAIAYMTTPDDARAALTTAALHCAPDGRVAVLPDHVRDSFEPSTDHGGEDGSDGRALRYLEWTHDADPDDDTYEVDYVYVLRDTDGSVRVEHERHVEGLFATDAWLGWFRDVGLDATVEVDRWERPVFVARPLAG
jgi:trans-aconitate methyltransferase